MFHNKYELPISADCFLNIYEGCNQGCDFCKFNKEISHPIPNKIIYLNYNNKKILVSYSTEPLPFENSKYTVEVIENLHKNNNKIIFLTRRPERVEKILEVFNKNDFIGVSISEPYNNNFENIERLIYKIKQQGKKCWISLEPILTLDFVKKNIAKFKEVDFIRVGKMDNNQNNKNWENVKKKLEKEFKNKDNVFIKE